MLLLNKKETKILLDVMEFLESLHTPEAMKHIESINDIIYAQIQGDADAVDVLLGCYNELGNDYKLDLIINQLYNLQCEKEKEIKKEISNDDGFHNVKLNGMCKELENIEKVIELLEVYWYDKIY